jgi:hypothetical protein
VDLEVAPRAVTTQCVKVVARTSGMPDEPSAPLSRAGGKSSFTVAVYQGDLPDNVSVLAQGFEDPNCTQLNEEGIPNAVRFVPGQVTHVSLRLEGSPCIGADAGTPCLSGVCRSDGACVSRDAGTDAGTDGGTDGGTELDCANGLDDDLDGKPDCRDPDCFSRACAPADKCVVGATCLADGGCGGGGPNPCDMPPGFCYGQPGTCSPANGVCSYVPDAGIGCDDSDLCTTSDHCQPDAGCSGTAVACNTPPAGTCFDPSGTCYRDAGCTYSVRVDAGCNDGDLCTFSDRCDVAGGCAGTSYSCPDTECGTRGCLGDGGCSQVSKTAQACDGGAGICNAAATCLRFPYVPANFNPSAIAPTLALSDGGVLGPITLNCNAWFNSTDGGFGWCSGQPLPSVTPITQNGGGTLAVVLGMTGLTMNTGTLSLYGNRPVILAVFGDVSIGTNGTISARSQLGGDAGAGSTAASACGAQDGNVRGGDVGSGAGGGSYGTAGGNGGDLTGGTTVQGGNGGSSYGGSTLTPLLGGCAGGQGGRPNDTAGNGGSGGAGGGGVQISAAGLLSISGTVTASGAGGEGGLRDQSGGTEGGNGGGGGGSGGSVLLEGQDILVPNTAKLTANGGGGGEGGDMANNQNNGDPGTDGPTTTAAGGTGGAGLTCSTDGAGGGSAVGNPGSAGNITYATGGCPTGGGGGAAGKIRVTGHGGCQVDAGVQSPTPSFGAPCP